MPWKSEVKNEIDKSGLSKVVNLKTPLAQVDLTKQANDV
jgi:hypothetical protein